MVDYKVAVEIMAAGNVEQFLEKMASKLLGIHGITKDIEKNIGGWGKLIGGAALALGGLEVLKFVDHIAKAGGELQRQANNFQSAGNSIQDTAKAISGAFAAIQKVPGVDAVDAMKRYRELAGATQDNSGSIAVLPDFLKAQVVYGATTGADAEAGMKRVAKMIELRQGAIDHLTHKINPQKFDKELDVAVKALQVGQGLITANDLQMLVKKAGPMAKGLDPLRFWSIYLASLEDMGGAATGTAMTATARQVLGGIMTPAVKEEWARLGMLDPQHHGWHRKKSGEIVIDDAQRAIRGYGTFRDEGFQAFIDKYVRPAFVKHGFTTDQQQNAELYRFGSTETARRLYSMYMTGSEQVEAEQKKISSALGLDAYDKIYKGGDYQQGIDSLTASIKSLEEALGGPAGKAMGAMATKLAEEINKVALIAHNNPEIVTMGTYAVTAAAGLAVLAGSVVALSGALRVGGWALGFGKGAPGAPAVKPPSAGFDWNTLTEIPGKLGKSGFAATIVDSIKGGIVGASVYLAGEWLINKLMPMTPEAEKLEQDTDPLNQLGKLLFGAPAQAAPLRVLNPAPLGLPRIPDLNPLGLNRFDFDDMRAGMDREAIRGRALGNLPRQAAPPPVVNLKNQFNAVVTVLLDGKQIAAQISSEIESKITGDGFTHGPASHDDHAHFAAPDLASGIGAH